MDEIDLAAGFAEDLMDSDACAFGCQTASTQVGLSAGADLALTTPTGPGAMAIGIPSIDADHRLLIECLRRLRSTSAECDDLNQRLCELADHVGDHFLREEQAMRHANYGDYRRHCDQHRAMIDLLAELFYQYELGGCSITPLTVDLLEFSFHTHLREADAQFATFLRRRSFHCVEPQS